MLEAFGVDIWLFTNERWYTRNPDGEYVPHEKRAIRADPTIVTDFAPHLAEACKIVGASSDFALLQRLRSGDEGSGRPGGDRGPFAELLSRRHPAGP